MENKDLKEKYDEMHKQGASSWFSDGQEERELILKMGDPWKNLRVLEIGCGTGYLASLVWGEGAEVTGVDYSSVAIKKAADEYQHFHFFCGNYHDIHSKYNRLVLQGVLEHFDDPFRELKWMMDNLLIDKGDVITSSPCFLNPRGIVWMTLDMLGAVMSKTDLHFLNPWEFQGWCEKQGFGFDVKYCDQDWGNDSEMIDDLSQRIPLALRDGKFLFDAIRFTNFLAWLESMKNYDNFEGYGATAVYRIIK